MPKRKRNDAFNGPFYRLTKEEQRQCQELEDACPVPRADLDPEDTFDEIYDEFCRIFRDQELRHLARYHDEICELLKQADERERKYREARMEELRYAYRNRVTAFFAVKAKPFCVKCFQTPCGCSK